MLQTIVVPRCNVQYDIPGDYQKIMISKIHDFKIIGQNGLIFLQNNHGAI